MDAHPATWPLTDARTPRPKTTCPAHPEEERILNYVCDGMSRALHATLRFVHLQGIVAYVPALWDERVVPLCDVDTPVASFLWDGSMPDYLAPRLSDVSELVRTIVASLHMNAQEVVIAMVLLETLLGRHGQVLQLYSARPLLLSTCILASKLARDTDAPSHTCLRAMQGHFTNLTLQLGARIERQLLEYLDWRIPNDPDMYSRYTIALLKEGTPINKLPLSVVNVPWVFS